jgi:hypothetical protein
LGATLFVDRAIRSARLLFSDFSADYHARPCLTFAYSPARSPTDSITGRLAKGSAPSRQHQPGPTRLPFSTPVRSQARRTHRPQRANPVSPQRHLDGFDSHSISATHFFGHSFGIIPAPGVFASSAFPVPPCESLGPSRNAATRLGSSIHSPLSAPRKWGRKWINKLCIYMLSGIVFRADSFADG